AAAVNLEGKLLAEERQLLEVSPGSRGLRQSEAVFQHVRTLPTVLKRLTVKMREGCDAGLWPKPGMLAAVSWSDRPRPTDDSYMPVFLVGRAVGSSLAEASCLPGYPTSHQEGHLQAGVCSAGGPPADVFLTVHLSGGTSEVLMVEQLPSSFRTELLGRSRDLHAGQLIDRVGVAMGLSFPAGPALERLAEQADDDFPRLSSAVEGLDFSFSGVESQAQRWIERGEAPARVARAVEASLANTMEKVIRRALEERGVREVLLVGGVAANRYLRQRLKQRLEHRAVGARLYFASPELSTDNAVGVAMLGWKRHLHKSR
ncbi:MAG: O-sialoglycoprotein endopeptidase, partial [Syntrophomonadaceae bacterium]|nr:O-sialoglycoprotein endopeptidase [Syntrophomonadaceae bacterium]